MNMGSGVWHREYESLGGKISLEQIVLETIYGKFYLIITFLVNFKPRILFS